MKKLLPIFIALLQTINVFTQIKFEDGYFIDNSGNKVECLLKNKDLKSTPETIKYKLNQKSEVKTLDLKSVKEFSVYKTYKFVKSTVKIGESSEQNEAEKEYTFKSKIIFLKVLVEGEANLYSYNEKGLKTFFYSTNSLASQQLVFKTYIPENFKTKRENNAYREQLFENLKCKSLTLDDAINLKYEEKDLINFFTKYNECQNSKNTVYLKKEKIFNINLRPRLTNASFTLSEIDKNSTLDFGNKTIFGIGIELEALLPFTNNKWSVSIEPTYQKYNAELTTNQVGVITSTSKVDYTSIEMPLTIRHYSFISNNSKIFLNASVVFDFSSKKSSIVNQFNDIIVDDLEIEPGLNFAFGMGYKYRDKYILELRFYSKRNLVDQLIDYTSSYSSTSLIFGYTLF